MKTRILAAWTAALLFATIGASALAVRADDPPQGEPKSPAPAHGDAPKGDSAKPGATQPAGTIGQMAANMPEYKRLAARGGEWDVKLSFTLQPGARPSQSTARCERRMILGGLFLESRLEGGNIDGMPFASIVHVGFDIGAREYIVNRMSSTNYAFMPERGTFDDATSTLNTTGEYKLPYAKIKARSAHRFESADKDVLEIYLSFNDAPEFKGIEMEFTRRK